MKYATEVTKYNHDKPQYLERFDELIIVERDDGTIFDFMKKFSTKAFVIRLDNIHDFLENNTINSYDNFTKENPEIDLKFSFYRATEYSQQLIDLMREHGHRFFYDDYVRTWDSLTGYVKEGVTDIYIVEEICFDLINVRKVVGDIRLRVIPHIAQSSYLKTPAMQKFFIRPDDVEFYEKYIDVFELLNLQNPNASVTMQRIYQDAGWGGNLSEIITDFNLDIDNRDILPLFAQHRISCGKRCMKGSGCSLCNQYASLAKTIKDNGMLIDKYHEFST